MSEESNIVNAELANVAPSDPCPSIDPINHPSGDGLVFVYREGYQVAKVEGPRIQKRLHTFHDLPSFADYLKRHADPQRCEILVDAEKVVAALDPKNIVGDLVTCELVKSPPFIAWQNHLGKSITQKSMFQHVRAQRTDLDPQIAAMLLGALQSLKLADGGEISLELDERGMTRLSAQTTKRNLTGEIPPAFSIHIPVFDGVMRVGEVSDLPTEPAIYDLEIFVSVDADRENGVTFLLNAPTRDSVVRQARRDAAYYLSRLLTDEFLVGLGQYAGSIVPAYSGASA